MIDYSKNNLVYWMWLTLLFGPSNRRKWLFLEEYDNDVVECYHSVMSGDHSRLLDTERRNLNIATLEKSKQILDDCEKKCMLVYGYQSEGYPKKLRGISNPPSVLFSYGNLDFLNNRAAIAVVGARKASDYSLEVTRRLANNLAKWGVVIVSGFAYGVDSQANRAAIEVGGQTVAVVASGLDYDYPQGTLEFKEVVARNGAVITEQFPGSPPKGNAFVARNRILSGISDGVLITEASKVSGSLNTASHAVSQGKEVYCVPPQDIFSQKYAGVSSLLRDGAIPVFSDRDILMQFVNSKSQSKQFARDLSQVFEKDSESCFADDLEAEKKRKTENGIFSRITKRKTADEKKRKNDPEAEVFKAEAEPAVMPDVSSLSEIQQKIVREIFEGTGQANELSAKLMCDISELFAELTELEMYGYVRSAAGNRYELNR